MSWLKSCWEWLEKNWKYVLTFGIPVLISFIASLIRSNQTLEGKVELEKDLRDADREAANIEAQKLDEARKQKEQLIAAAERTHDALIHQVKEDMAKRIQEIETAEEATAAIQEKLNENNEKTT